MKLSTTLLVLCILPAVVVNGKQKNGGDKGAKMAKSVDMGDKADKMDKGDKMDKDDKSVKSDKADKSAKNNKDDKSAKNNKDDKSAKSNKSNKNKDTSTKKTSALANFLGGFKTVIDILKTGDASELAQSTCDGVVNAFGIQDTMDCYCNATLIEGFKEVEGTLHCLSSDLETCVDMGEASNNGTIGTEACGAVLLGTTLQGGLDTEVEGNVVTCLGANLPEDLGFYEVCIDTNFTMSGITECVASMNAEPCSCTPCENSFSVVYDCQHVNVSPFAALPVYGPKVDTCHQLNFQQSQQ